ncbi:hypothetical protein [Mycoplasma hafezii]|uniref:hypothetical protein n=1 Tax=Mycoplasma hafezii TaxID=525886 RepID=UPI003CEE4E71
MLIIVILGILNLLLSNNIFILNILGEHQPFYARILSNLIYTVITFVVGFFLIFKRKISTFFFNNSVFILGVFVTFAWIPTAIVNKETQDASYNWMWYKGDVFAVFATYAVIYIVSLALITNKNIYWLKEKFAQKKTQNQNNIQAN